MSNFDDYVVSLSQEQQRLSMSTREILARELYQEQAELLGEWIFLPDLDTNLVYKRSASSSPAFSDSQEVLWQVFEELAGAETRELPIAAWCYRSVNRITRKSEPLGFLLTDNALYVQDTPTAIFARELPRRQELRYPTTAEDAKTCAAEVFHAAGDGYDWSFAEPIIREGLVPALTKSVEEGLVLVLPLLADAGYVTPPSDGPLPSNGPKTFRQAAESHGLADVLATTESKKSAKSLSKLRAIGEKTVGPRQEQAIPLAFIDRTLAGPYGLLLTDDALYSRDVMEPMFGTHYAEVLGQSARISEDGKKLVLSGGKEYFVPESASARTKAAVAALVTDILSGRVQFE